MTATTQKTSMNECKVLPVDLVNKCFPEFAQKACKYTYSGEFHWAAITNIIIYNIRLNKLIIIQYNNII